MTAATPARHVWYLDLLGRPPTANKQRGRHSHWSQTADETRVWRDLAKVNQLNAVRKGQAPRSLDAISVTVCQLSKDRRWLQDLGGCFPAAKAAIDRLVDAGLIPDDTHDHLKHLGFTTPEIVGRDAMRLYIREVRT